mgnify:CR=1 FL=1
MGIFKKLFKTRDKISGALSKIFNTENLTDEEYEKIEECLLGADISWSVTEKIVNSIKNYTDKSTWKESLKSDFRKILDLGKVFEIKNNIIMIGVNGAGKTTASAKLANYLKNDNKNIMLVAADTYRAAAIEQLRIWSNRVNVEFLANEKTNDPASVAFDGVNSGKTRNMDHVIIDTAGRLQTSQNLMKELEKIYRVITKVSDDITILMNLDADVGQNGLKQVEEFNSALPVDGIILNKMDGTAKGGVAVSIVDKFKIPILFLGMGEKIENIVPFDIDTYVDSIISFENEKKEEK